MSRPVTRDRRRRPHRPPAARAAGRARRSTGRLPSVVAGVRARRRARLGRRRTATCPATTARHAVPDRLDHQDHDRGAGAPARARGPARRSTTPVALGARRRRVRRPDRPRAAGARRRAAGRAERLVVGAVRGRLVRRARRRQRRRPARRSTAHRQFHYSNLGYGLLGEVVARLRGGTWWDGVRDADPRAAGHGRARPTSPRARTRRA